ncbi:MAG: hypothetical protein QMD50_02630 [Patescibacteria group bacterium]|nr:hypothetical protein [Patescibacteria group bacterium]
MHEEIIKNLKKLRTIRPDEQFIKNSRGLILATYYTPNKLRITWPVLAWSAVAAFSVILIISLTLPRIQNSKILSSSLNRDKIEQELNNLTINIQLEQITYSQTISQTIASALTEISDTHTKHLNKNVLESEQKSLDGLDLQNSEIDRMLNQVIF